MRAARIDRTAPVLVAAIKRLGSEWLPWPGGPVDGFILWRGQVLMVDFKATGTSRRTKKQQALVASGWPIHFVSTCNQLLDVLDGLRTMAKRPDVGLPCPAQERTPSGAKA